tara:strand:- start:9199 stop:9711 length:513 start_codon:yes stop_codon:yes gene_type:complete
MDEDYLKYLPLKNDIKPNQRGLVKYIWKEFMEGNATVDDIKELITLYYSLIDNEKPSCNDIALKATRLWIISNLHRVLSEEFIHPESAPSVQEKLQEYPAIIDNLITIHEILSSDKSTRKVMFKHFLQQLSCIILVDCDLSNSGSGEIEIGQFLEILVDESGNDDNNHLC